MKPLIILFTVHRKSEVNQAMESMGASYYSSPSSSNSGIKLVPVLSIFD